MDTAQRVDPDSPEVIRERIEETRASLGHKLESLETEVRSSVQEASVSVKERVDNVKKVFDVRHQVATRPWLSVGAAFAVGAALGALASNQQSRGGYSPRGLGTGAGVGAPLSSRPRRYGASTLGWIARQVEPEVNSIKALAIGTAVSALGDFLKEALPTRFQKRVDPLVASATDKLGGELAEPQPGGDTIGNGHHTDTQSYTPSDGYPTAPFDPLASDSTTSRRL